MMLLQYVFIFVLILMVTNILLSENEFESVSNGKDVCGHLGLCGTEDEPGILRCHCDELCPFYGDCCLGFKPNLSATDGSREILTEHTSVSARLGCESVRGNNHNFWIINKLPADNFHKHSLCASSEDPVFSTIPVYDPISQLHYRNIYCARFRSSVKFWRVKVTGCVEKIGEYSQTVAGGIKGLYDVYKRIFDESSCQVKFIPPEDSNPRICFRSDAKCIGTDFHSSCFHFQNPVTRVRSDLYATSAKYKTYRNYFCQKCEQESDAADKILCRQEKFKALDFTQEKSAILNHIKPEVLIFTFIQPKFCGREGTPEKRRGVCRTMSCTNGLAQNYFDCTNPISSVQGISLDLSLRLFNQSSYVGLLPLNIIRGIFDGELQKIFKAYTLKISSSSLRGVLGEKKMPCVIYTLRAHLLLNDFIEFDRSLNIFTEVEHLFQTQKAAIESAGKMRPIAPYAQGNNSDSECSPIESEIDCPQSWILLLISFAISAGFFMTSLFFECLGHSLGSFAKFEFMVFKAVHLVTDLSNMGAVLMACSNMTLLLRNAEVGIHWLYLAEHIWLTVTGYRVWRTMIARTSPVKVSTKPFSKRCCCFSVFLTTGVVVVFSNLASFLQLGTIAVTYDNGGTLFRSKFDFAGISLLLFIPWYFGIAASTIFCVSVLIASRHEKKKILRADHWLIQNFRLLTLLAVIFLKDIIYATKPLIANTTWQLLRAISFTFTGTVAVIMELCLLVKFKGR